MNTELVATQHALDRLNKSLAKTSLDDLITARTRRSLLLVDCSGSMADRIRRTGERKIDALRKTVTTLRETHPVPVAAFGVRALAGGQVEVVDRIPEPCGGTPMDEAIAFGGDQGANHLLIVTDGQPNNEEQTFTAARAFSGSIDVFYVGDGRDRGAAFAAELAALKGGTAHVNDMSQPKELAGKLVLMLGDGSETI